MLKAKFLPPLRIARTCHESKYYIFDSNNTRVYGRGFRQAFAAVEWIRMCYPVWFKLNLYFVSNDFTIADTRPTQPDRKTLSTGEKFDA